MTDDPAEWDAFRSLLREVDPDLIQWRNLNLDPAWYWETARPFAPEALLGVYLLDRTGADGEVITYLRFAFIGRVGEPLPGRTLDTPVVATHWLDVEDLRRQAGRRDHSSAVRRSESLK